MECRFCLGLAGEGLATEVIDLIHAYFPGLLPHGPRTIGQAAGARSRDQHGQRVGTHASATLGGWRQECCFALDPVVFTEAGEMPALDETQ
jgi:hypothetical protein